MNIYARTKLPLPDCASGCGYRIHDWIEFVEFYLFSPSDKYFKSLRGSQSLDISCIDLFLHHSPEFPDEIVWSHDIELFILSSYNALGVGIMRSLAVSPFLRPLGSLIHSSCFKEWSNLSLSIWPQNLVDRSDASSSRTLWSFANDVTSLPVRILLSLLARFWTPNLWSCISSWIQSAFNWLLVSWLEVLRIIVINE